MRVGELVVVPSRVQHRPHKLVCVEDSFSLSVLFQRCRSRLELGTSEFAFAQKEMSAGLVSAGRDTPTLLFCHELAIRLWELPNNLSVRFQRPL